jgi:hypothetical protein
MASRRKRFTPTKPPASQSHLYADFIARLLDQTIKATALHEVKNGRLRLEYDDPDGEADARGRTQ